MVLNPPLQHIINYSNKTKGVDNVKRLYMWSYTHRGLLRCVTGTREEFYNDLKREFSEAEQEKIKQNVRSCIIW